MSTYDNLKALHLLDCWAPQFYKGRWWISTVTPPMTRICVFKANMDGDESGHIAASLVCAEHNKALNLAKVDAALAKPLPVSNTPYCCPICGGSIVGDGITMVEHCEFASDELYMYIEPDGGPIWCSPGANKVTAS